MKKPLPDFTFEKKFWEKGYIVIGVDEVGRGALAGPLVVGSVCFNPYNGLLEKISTVGINDSKKLTRRIRSRLSTFIKQKAYSYSTAEISTSVINRLGISKAFQMGARKAISLLRLENGKKKYILVDAFYIKYLYGVGIKNQKAIIHGDEKSISIAAASIIAKVKRDALMSKLHRQYPLYKWRKNKGYGTRIHREAIRKHGKTKLHRDLFIRKVLLRVV